VGDEELGRMIKKENKWCEGLTLNQVSFQRGLGKDDECDYGLMR